MEVPLPDTDLAGTWAYAYGEHLVWPADGRVFVSKDDVDSLVRARVSARSGRASGWDGDWDGTSPEIRTLEKV